MNDINPVFLIFMIICAIGFVVCIIAYFLWIILHKILGPKLDGILFREPYFQKAELINYQVWPLSLVKSINYIYLVAIPGWAKKRRFKGLNEELPVGRALKIACKIQFSAMFIGAIMFFVFFGYMGIAIYFFS